MYSWAHRKFSEPASSIDEHQTLIVQLQEVKAPVLFTCFSRHCQFVMVYDMLFISMMVISC